MAVRTGLTGLLGGLALALSAVPPALEWSERQPMPVAEAGGAAAWLDGELVVAGGTTWTGDTKHTLDAVQIYNPETNRWRQGPALPYPLAYGAAYSTPQGFFVLGGSDGAGLHREILHLDSRKQKWTVAGEATSSPLLGRALAVGGKVFLFGGCRDAAELKSCTDRVYRLEGSQWREIGVLPQGRAALFAVAAAGGRILVFGGCRLPAGSAVENLAEVYALDPATGAWERQPDLPRAARGLAAVALNGRRILLLGGYTDSGFSAEVWSFDPDTGRYTAEAPMPAPVMAAEFFRHGDTIFGAGGEDRRRGRSARLFAAKLITP